MDTKIILRDINYSIIDTVYIKPVDPRISRRQIILSRFCYSSGQSFIKPRVFETCLMPFNKRQKDLIFFIMIHLKLYYVKTRKLNAFFKKNFDKNQSKKIYYINIEFYQKSILNNPYL